MNTVILMSWAVTARKPWQDVLWHHRRLIQYPTSSPSLPSISTLSRCLNWSSYLATWAWCNATLICCSPREKESASDSDPPACSLLFEHVMSVVLCFILHVWFLVLCLCVYIPLLVLAWRIHGISLCYGGLRPVVAGSIKVWVCPKLRCFQLNWGSLVTALVFTGRSAPECTFKSEFDMRNNCFGRSIWICCLQICICGDCFVVSLDVAVFASIPISFRGFVSWKVLFIRCCTLFCILEDIQHLEMLIVFVHTIFRGFLSWMNLFEAV